MTIESSRSVLSIVETLAASNTVEETVSLQSDSVEALENASKVLNEKAVELEAAIHLFRI